MTYVEDFRDAALKINDDRKIQIQLGAITKPGTMILLVVKEYDTTNKPVQEGEFDRAWFRLSNEETNQTLDYSLVNKVEKPDEYNPIIPADEDDENSQPRRNDLTYIHGRLYLDENKRWVFESYKHCFQTKDYEDIVASMGKLYGQSVAEFNDQKTALSDASNTLKRSAEEKKLAALEAAKKSKGKKKGAKKVEDDEPAAKNDGNGDSPSTPNGVNDENFDLQSPAGFEKALIARIGRPFLFGPVEFDGLNDEGDFDFEAARELVISQLNRSPLMPQNTCIHGYNVLVKNRNLKRRSSLLKHSRFLRNLKVTANYPAVKEEPKEKEDEDEDEE